VALAECYWRLGNQQMALDLLDRSGYLRLSSIKLLGDMLVDGKADKWKGRTLYALCAGLIEAGLGRSHVLPIAQRRDAAEQTRLIALDCLRNDDALAEEVCKFRFGAMFDSSAVKQRIREIAKARKG